MTKKKQRIMLARELRTQGFAFGDAFKMAKAIIAGNVLDRFSCVQVDSVAIYDTGGYLLGYDVYYKSDIGTILYDVFGNWWSI